MTHAYVWHDAFICVTWLIHMCDMTHLCVTWPTHVWHDLFMCATWLIHMCDMTHACVWHDSCIRMTCTYLYVYHMCIYRYIFMMYSLPHLKWQFRGLFSKGRSKSALVSFYWNVANEIQELSFQALERKFVQREVGGGAGVEYHFQEISWNLRPVVNGTYQRVVGFIEWYSTPSPNLSPYIFLGLDPSSPPLESSLISFVTVNEFSLQANCRVKLDRLYVYVGVCISVCVCVFVCVWSFKLLIPKPPVYTYLYLYTQVCIYVCVCMYIYVQAKRGVPAHF